MPISLLPNDDPSKDKLAQLHSKKDKIDLEAHKLVCHIDEVDLRMN